MSVLLLLASPPERSSKTPQQLSFFKGHYDTWCYLPLLGFLSFNDELEQYLVTAVLRPGNAPAARGAVGLLRRLLRRIRRAFPRAAIRVRLDGRSFESSSIMSNPRGFSQVNNAEFFCYTCPIPSPTGTASRTC